METETMHLNATPTKTDATQNQDCDVTPKRPMRTNSVSPFSPNCCSESNSPVQTPRRSVRERRLPLKLKMDLDDGKGVETKKFYKPNKKYLNPFERMLRGKPRVTIPPASSVKKQLPQRQRKVDTKSKAIKKKTVNTRKYASKTVAKKSTIKKYLGGAAKIKASPKVVKSSFTSLKAPKETGQEKTPQKIKTLSPNKSPKILAKSAISVRKKILQSPSKSPAKRSLNSPANSLRKRIPQLSANKQNLVKSPSPVKCPRKNARTPSNRKVTPSKSPGKKISSPKSHKKPATSPRKSPKKKATTPKKNTTSPQKTTKTAKKITTPQKSPKKITASGKSPKIKKTSPVKSPKKRVPSPTKSAKNSPLKKGAPRKFFTNRPPITGKSKVDAKKWVAQLAKKKPKQRKNVSKSRTAPNRKRKAKSDLTEELPRKQQKVGDEKENVSEEKSDAENQTNVALKCEESANATNDVPLKESNSPRRVKTSSSPVKLTPIEDVPEPIEENPIVSNDEQVLKENNIPSSVTPSEEEKGSPKTVKLFPIFAKATKNRKASPRTPKKRDPSSPQSPTKQRLKSLKKFNSKDSKGQMIIDAGQNELGGKMCATCNMVFTVGQLEDEELHAKYHNRFVQRLRFIGWKTEKVVWENSEGRIIIVLPEDQNYKLRKIEEIRAFVDECLGYPSVAIPDDTSVYLLYICKQKVVGCLIAQRIKLAYRVLPPKENQPEMNYETMLCSTDAVPALCGVSRIWTAPKYRRKKIATRMLDSLRCNFFPGHHLAINDVAFSDPSPAGRMFAAYYMRCNTFLVYK